MHDRDDSHSKAKIQPKYCEKSSKVDLYRPKECCPASAFNWGESSIGRSRTNRAIATNPQLCSRRRYVLSCNVWASRIRMLELTAYLDHPAKYTLEYVDRIVDRLVAAAGRARDEREVLLSASLFNRALAYKPHDSELIVLVVRLAKQRAWSKRLRQISLIGASAAVAASGGLLVVRTYNSRLAQRRQHLLRVCAFAGNQSRDTHCVEYPGGRKEFVPGRRQGTGQATRGPRKRPTRDGECRSFRIQPICARCKSSLRVPRAGVLMIDGEEQPWFGVRHELTVGTASVRSPCSQRKLLCATATEGRRDNTRQLGPESIFGHRISRSHAVCARTGWRNLDLR